jgi:DNA uptake protein ComE-like DNA-binding protein
MRIHLANPITSIRGERASVLVIVLWITFGLVSLAIYFAQSSNFEFRAADNRVASIEAEQAIEGAARYVSNLLAAVLLQTNVPPELPDPTLYQPQEVRVGDARFWLIGRSTNNIVNGPLTPTFGLIDEASKLNANTATFAMLEWLPRMTPDLAADIVGWHSGSANSSGYGVSSNTYSQINPPYLCKSSAFETLEELRLVYGLTPDILYGEDMNLNGVLDANENDGDANPPSDDLNGTLDPGLFEYLTVWTREPNTASDGSQRINVNTTNALQQLASTFQDKFGASRANQILLAAGLQTAPSGNNRQGTGGTSNRGGSTGTTGGTGGRGGNPPGGTTPAATATFGSVLEFYLKSGMSPDEFAQVSDLITTTNSTYITGLVNVNTASQAVLSCVPGIGSNSAPAVVSYRMHNAAYATSVAWVSNVLDQNSAIQAGPYITARSYQFTADVAAVGHYGRGYRRVRLVFDISEGVPKIIYRQDLTHLGWALGKDLRDKILLAQNRR